MVLSNNNPLLMPATDVEESKSVLVSAPPPETPALSSSLPNINKRNSQRLVRAGSLPVKARVVEDAPPLTWFNQESRYNVL